MWRNLASLRYLRLYYEGHVLWRESQPSRVFSPLFDAANHNTFPYFFVLFLSLALFRFRCLRILLGDLCFIMTPCCFVSPLIFFFLYFLRRSPTCLYQNRFKKGSYSQQRKLYSLSSPFLLFLTFAIIWEVFLYHIFGRGGDIKQ